RDHNVGRLARSTSTASTRWLARTRAKDRATRTNSGSVWTSSSVQSKRCTQGSSSRRLSWRQSIGHRSPFDTRQGGSKSVPYVCCYASPPLTEICARSWLNIAEIELSVLTKQCLDRRIAAIDTLRQETKAWEHERKAKQTGVNWHCTTEDTRIRLKRLYPQYQ